MWPDLRYAVRVLFKSPAFTVTTVAVLALGIGANTAIFSVINSVLLNPSGIKDPDRVVVIRVKYDKLNLKSISTSAPDMVDIRESKEIFSSAALLDQADFNYSGSGSPERLVGSRVSWQWFDVFGARPVLGRLFRAEDDVPDSNNSIVLAYATWQRLFGGDESIVGRTVELNLKPFKVAGVMGPEFHVPNRTDLWVPIGLTPQDYSVQNRHNQSYLTVARLKPGLSFSNASAWTGVLTQQILQREDQGGYAKASAWGIFAVPYLEFVAGDLRTPLLTLQGAVGFVLLIACSNIAGLLLARASSRSREVSVRAALGAGRWRLIRQIAVESLLLSLTGGILGMAVGLAGVRLLLLLAPAQQTAGILVRTDLPVLGFSAGVTMLSAILFGLIPAWQIAGTGQFETLKEGGRAGTAGRTRQRLRGALVAGEFAFALVLLVGAGLSIRSLARLEQVDPGFRMHGVMSGIVSLPENRYKEDRMKLSFYRAVLDKLSGLPSVESAAAVMPLPFSGSNWSASFGIEGRQQLPGDPGPHGDVRYISPQYFGTLGIPILAGRAFTDQDREGADSVAMIDTVLARQYWPGENPLGKRIRRGSRSPWATIVGIAGHVHHSELTSDSKGVYYFPSYQQALPFSALIIKSSGSPEALAGAMRRAVSEVDPSQPVHDLKSMEFRVSESLGARRFAVTLLGFFAVLAVGLAAIGIYGVISYSVTQRTQELGIRLALGAKRWQIFRLVLGQGMTLTAVGVLAGLAGSSYLVKWLSSQLFEVSRFDPVTFVITTIILALVAAVACYLPALRATRVDPLVALRYE